MRPTFFNQWDCEVAKRNDSLKDSALLAEEVQKAGFLVLGKIAAEMAPQSGSPTLSTECLPVTYSKLQAVDPIRC